MDVKEDGELSDSEDEAQLILNELNAISGDARPTGQHVAPFDDELRSTRTRTADKLLSENSDRRRSERYRKSRHEARRSLYKKRSDKDSSRSHVYSSSEAKDKYSHRRNLHNREERTALSKSSSDKLVIVDDKAMSDEDDENDELLALRQLALQSAITRQIDLLGEFEDIVPNIATDFTKVVVASADLSLGNLTVGVNHDVDKVRAETMAASLSCEEQQSVPDIVTVQKSSLADNYDVIEMDIDDSTDPKDKALSNYDHQSNGLRPSEVSFGHISKNVGSNKAVRGSWKMRDTNAMISVQQRVNSTAMQQTQSPPLRNSLDEDEDVLRMQSLLSLTSRSSNDLVTVVPSNVTKVPLTTSLSQLNSTVQESAANVTNVSHVSPSLPFNPVSTVFHNAVKTVVLSSVSAAPAFSTHSLPVAVGNAETELHAATVAPLVVNRTSSPLLQGNTSSVNVKILPPPPAGKQARSFVKKVVSKSISATTDSFHNATAKVVQVPSSLKNAPNSHKPWPASNLKSVRSAHYRSSLSLHNKPPSKVMPLMSIPFNNPQSVVPITKPPVASMTQRPPVPALSKPPSVPPTNVLALKAAVKQPPILICLGEDSDSDDGEQVTSAKNSPLRSTDAVSSNVLSKSALSKQLSLIDVNLKQARQEFERKRNHIALSRTSSSGSLPVPRDPPSVAPIPAASTVAETTGRVATVVAQRTAVGRVVDNSLQLNRSSSVPRDIRHVATSSSSVQRVSTSSSLQQTVPTTSNAHTRPASAAITTEMLKNLAKDLSDKVPVPNSPVTETNSAAKSSSRSNSPVVSLVNGRLLEIVSEQATTRSSTSLSSNLDTEVAHLSGRLSKLKNLRSVEERLLANTEQRVAHKRLLIKASQKSIVSLTERIRKAKRWQLSQFNEIRALSKKSEDYQAGIDLKRSQQAELEARLKILEKAATKARRPSRSREQNAEPTYIYHKTVELDFDDRVTPSTGPLEVGYSPYVSSLIPFKRYRLLPQLKQSPVSVMSLTVSHKMDAGTCLCPHDLAGVCSSSDCTLQHHATVVPTVSQVVSELVLNAPSSVGAAFLVSRDKRGSADTFAKIFCQQMAPLTGEKLCDVLISKVQVQVKQAGIDAGSLLCDSSI